LLEMYRVAALSSYEYVPLLWRVRIMLRTTLVRPGKERKSNDQWT
jgi:hypothetical protein